MPKRKKSPKKNNNFLSTILGLILAIVAVVGAAYFFLQSRGPKELETVKVSLVWLHQAQFAGVYTAIEKGYYEDVGLYVEVEEFEFGRELELELVNGETDFSILHSVRLLESIGQGLDVQAVASIYQTSPHAFVAGEGAAIANPEDLKGKTLGVKGDNISAKILYSVLLAQLGLKEKDVNFKSMDFSTHEFEDIQSGAVDMIDLYRTDQTYFFEKNDVPYQIIPPENFSFDMYGDVIATSGEKVRNNPKLVKKFVKATLKGWDYALDNHNKALEMTNKYIVSEDYQNDDYNNFILNKSHSLIKPETGNEIGNMEFVKWKGLYEVMFNNDLIETEFDINSAFTTEFID